MWSIHSLFDDSWAEEWNRGGRLRPLQPRQSCLSKILESWSIKLIKLWSFADIISDREEPHQPILLPKHRLSNCRSMDMCSWWRLCRQGDPTTFDRLHLARWRSFWFNTTGFLRHDFSQHLYQQLKALKNTTKLLHWVCRAQTSGASLLLPNMDQIKPSSHTCLALPLKTNTDSCTRQHSMTNSPIIVKSVQRYNADAHRLLAAQGLAPKLHYWATM